MNTISLLCGFLTIFSGVYLLNLSREDPDGSHLGIKSGDERGKYHEVEGIPSDGLAGIATRMSMQTRRSADEERERHRRSTSWSLRSPITGTYRREDGDRQHLIHNYDIEANNLDELAEDSEDDSGRKRTSFEDSGGNRVVVNGGRSAGGSGFGTPRRSRTVEGERIGVTGKSLDQARR